MRASEARELLREITASYFSGASVIIGRQSHVAKPALPLVSITGGNVSRPLNPVEDPIDGVPVGYYQSTMRITIDLFTHGKLVTDATSGKSYYDDTAVEDLLWYADFLNSEYCIDWCSTHDIAILIDGDVQDMTGIINETTYEYRARMNVLVYFTEIAVGRAAVLSESSIVAED